MSVSRFSMRRISGSLPAAAATLSIENPGMPSSRFPTGGHYPEAGCDAALARVIPRRGRSDSRRWSSRFKGAIVLSRAERHPGPRF
jgi:hypothetical protein